MSSKTLARTYDKLTPQERVSLCVAAQARGDIEERDRIMRAGGTITMTVPDDHGIRYGLFVIAMMSLAEQLASAVCFWQMHSFAGDEPLPAESSEDVDRLGFLLDISAWRFRMERKAWRLFCGDLNVDPDALLAGMPGQRQIESVESIMLGGPSDDELAERIRDAKRLPGDAKLISAESILASYRELYSDVADRWA